MAELGIAASVIGIAVVGMKAAKGLVEIADAIGSAGEEVRLGASDTALFSQLLNDLGDALRKPTAVSRANQNLAEDTLDVCERILTPFNNLIAKLTPLLDHCRRSQHQFQQLSLRIQWYFKHKPKVIFYQQSLGHLKGTLSCLLASMNLQESRASAPQNIFISHMQVENSKASIEQQGRSDRATLVHTIPGLHIDGQLDSPGTRIESTVSILEPEIEEPLDDPGHLTAAPEPAKVEVELTDTDEMDEDAGYDTAVALRIDLLSFQRKTLNFAKSALNPAASQQQARPREPPNVEPTSAEASGTSIPRKPVSDQKKVVYFIDPDKVEHSFPLERCKTWSNAKNMVRWKLDPFHDKSLAMDYEQFDMCLSGEGVVDGDDWPSRIAPGMSIYLKYY